MDDNYMKNKRLKLYMGSLFPINPSLVKNLDLTKLNTHKDQGFIYKEDIHRELFCNLLLMIGREKQRKPSFEKVTFNSLVEHHFNPDHPSSDRYVIPEVLFIAHLTSTLDNKIYGPILDKIVEERRAHGRRTYFFYKGDAIKYRDFKTTSMDEVIDFNLPNRNNRTRSEVL